MTGPTPAPVPHVSDVLQCAGRTYVVVARRWEDGTRQMTLVLREEGPATPAQLTLPPHRSAL